MSFYRGPRRIPAEFVGQSTETLQAWLTEAQLAMRQLRTGGRAISLSYNMGAGSKAVTYQATNIGDLQNYIDELAYVLGLAPRRYAMSPGF